MNLVGRVKPEWLDLFACEGGASAGYMRAGFNVTAVDLEANRLKYNPAPTKHVGDAIAFLEKHGKKFQGVHMSPPCQWYTAGRRAHRDKPSRWERSIPTVREAVQSLGKPYVIENVKDAKWDMEEPVTLCGCMFDLKTIDTDGIEIHLQRPRLFETNWKLKIPRECDHSAHEWVAGAYGGARRDKFEAKFIRKGGYVPPNKDVVKSLLGIRHNMTWNGLYESVPPVYTKYVGRKVLRYI